MSALLFWSTVIICTVILGFLLPKIFNLVFRILLFVVAFILILFGLSKAGLTPDTFTKKISSFFSQDAPVKKASANCHKSFKK